MLACWTAAARPQATAFGADAYLDLPAKAAALVHSLARNRAGGRERAAGAGRLDPVDQPGQGVHYLGTGATIWPHLYLELTVQLLDDCHCPARFMKPGQGRRSGPRRYPNYRPGGLMTPQRPVLPTANRLLSGRIVSPHRTARTTPVIRGCGPVAQVSMPRRAPANLVMAAPRYCAASRSRWWTTGWKAARLSSSAASVATTRTWTTPRSRLACSRYAARTRSPRAWPPMSSTSA